METSLELMFSSTKRWSIQYSKWNKSVQEARPICLKLEHNVPDKNISVMKFVICLFPRLSSGEAKIMGNIGTQKLKIDENFYCNITYRIINNLTDKPFTKDASSTFNINNISSGRTVMLEDLDYTKEEDPLHTIEFKFTFSLKLEGRTDGLISMAQNITNYLHGNEKNHDVTIKCKERMFKTNSLILKGRSETFKAILPNNIEQEDQGIIILDEYSPIAVEEMINYILTSNLSNNLAGNVLLDLMHMADTYSLRDLFGECMIQSNNKLENVNSIRALNLMERRELGNTTKNLLFDCLAKDFENLAETQEWTLFQSKNPILIKDFLGHMIRGAEGPRSSKEGRTRHQNNTK